MFFADTYTCSILGPLATHVLHFEWVMPYSHCWGECHACSTRSIPLDGSALWDRNCRRKSSTSPRSLADSPSLGLKTNPGHTHMSAALQNCTSLPFVSVVITLMVVLVKATRHVITNLFIKNNSSWYFFQGRFILLQQERPWFRFLWMNSVFYTTALPCTSL